MPFDFHGLHDLAIIGLIALIGFYLGRLFHGYKLPGILGWMVFGIFLGPSVFGLLTEHKLQQLGFISELTLGLAAFSIGTELRFPTLRSLGSAVIAIMFCQSIVAFVLVFGAVWFLTADIPMALVFASIAPATSPAGTMAIIQECRAKGPLTTALFAAVGVDDGLTVVIYAFAATFARDLLERDAASSAVRAASSLWFILYEPLLQIGEAIVIGVVIGLVLSRLIGRLQEQSGTLIVLIGFVLLSSGLALTGGASVILTNLVVGLMFTNTLSMATINRVARHIRLIMPLFFVIFYGLAGAHLNLAALPSLGLLGLAYVVFRSVGLIAGSRLGAEIGGVDENIKKYLGPGIITQAGVAIGLALITMTNFEAVGTPHAREIGVTVITTITATSVLFEVVGPLLTKYALEAAGEVGKG